MNHAPFDRLLLEHVDSDGLVDHDAFGSSSAERQLLLSGEFRLRFSDYDWSLNLQPQ